jgi:hypothetical protein
MQAPAQKIDKNQDVFIPFESMWPILAIFALKQLISLACYPTWSVFTQASIVKRGYFPFGNTTSGQLGAAIVPKSRLRTVSSDLI